MAIILRLQGLPWSATASDIRQYFVGLNIPDGGVHIVGGDDGDVFIAFASDEDARQAMRRQKEPLMGVRVMILLSSKSEMQEVIAKSRQAQGRDPFHMDTPKESSATADPSGQQQSFDRRDTSFASPMSPDPSQGGRPVVGDNFQDRRMTNADLPSRKSEMPYEDPYYQSSRAITPENGSFGQTGNNKPREFQDHDRRTPQQTWQNDAYPDLRRDSGSASFNNPQQPFYPDHNRGADGLLGEVPGRQGVNHPPRGQQSDQHWLRGNTRNRDSFESGHDRDDLRDVSATGFNQQGRLDSNQRYCRPPHPQDPFEGAGRDFGRREYAQEPGRNNHPPQDRNFEPPKEGPPAPSDANLPHDITYKHELEESLCVYLKGLPFTIKEHEVVDFFRGLRIARDGIKFVLDPLGRPTGEGFVKFVSKRDTVDALKRHKSFIANRYVQVIPCTEIEYQTMLKPKVLQSADRHGHDGPPPRDREMLQRNNTHGIPALLELPTQEPFAPQDRDHRKDMPFSGRDNFTPRNRGPGGDNYGREGDSFQEGFNPSIENFNPNMRGVHPGSREAVNASSTDRFIPDNRENFTPDSRDRFNHGSRDHFPPDDSFSSGRDDFAPGSRKDHHHQGGRKGFPPGSREGFPQGDRDGFPPGRREGFPPGGREGFAPGGREGFAPGGREGFPPGGRDGFPPGGRESFPPGGRDGFPPGGRDGFPQGGREGFPPGGREGFHPGGREGFPPGGREGFPPSSRDGFPPNSRDGFSTGSRGFNSRDRMPGGPANRGPGGPHQRFRDDDPIEARIPGGMRGTIGMHSDDRGEFDNNIPGNFNGPQSRNFRMQGDNYERGRQEVQIERERGQQSSYFDREHEQPDGPSDKDRSRLEKPFERDHRRQGGNTERESGWSDVPSDRRRLDRPSDRDRRSESTGDRDRGNRPSHKDKNEPDTRSSSSDSKDKGATVESSKNRNSPVRNKERDSRTSERGSSKERRGSDRSRSKDSRDKTSSSEERSRDRGRVHNGPSRGDHSDRDRRRSPSKSSRSHRDRSRSPIRSQCVELKGIPPECQTEDIYQFFKGLQVASEGIFIPYDSKTGKVIGHCYVKFSSDQDAINACKRSGNTIGRNAVEISGIPKEIMDVKVKDYKKRLMDSTTATSPNVKSAQSTQEQKIKETEKNVESHEPKTLAKMENVPYVCTLDEIFQFYPDCKIARRGVNFIRHVDGVNAGKSSGVIFMEFVSEADATRAIAKSEQTIRGRKVTITAVSRKIFDETVASQANVPDRRYMHRDADDRMANSGPSSVPGGPVPMVQRFGSGPLLRPGMGKPLGLARLNPFGKPRPGLLQSGPRQLFGSPHMTGEDTDGPDLNIQKLGSNNCVLGITNLPTDAGIKVILNFFQGFSPISNSVRLHFNNGGQPTGDALIAFPSSMLADNAITELNGALLGGRRIGLKITQPPPGVM